MDWNIYRLDKSTRKENNNLPFCYLPSEKPLLLELVPIPTTVAPQETLELEYKAKLPDYKGDYILSVELVSQGVLWFSKPYIPSSIICYKVMIN